jgi:hypothetical protein
MQHAQRLNGHILPAIDGLDANWLRGVELLLIAFRSGGSTLDSIHAQTNKSAIVNKM